MTLIYFLSQNGQYGFVFWLPTIIKNLTKTDMTSVGLLAAVPYIASLGGLYLFSKLSDESMNRRRYTIIVHIGFAGSFFLSTQFPDSQWISYSLLVVTGLFLKAFSPVFWAMPSMLFPTGLSGVARGIINALGCLGGVVGPFWIGLMATYHHMNWGIYGLTVSLAAVVVVAMFLPDVTAGKNEKVNADSSKFQT